MAYSLNYERTPLIGEVYMIRFGVGKDGNVQKGMRPGLVFQNNVGNKHSPNLIVLPLTSSLKKLGQPTHVLLKSSETGLIKDSLVLCENPECVSKANVGAYVTTLSESQMQQVAIAHLIATGAIAFLDVSTMLQVHEASSRLNKTR